LIVPYPSALPPAERDPRLCDERELWRRYQRDRGQDVREELLRRYLPFARRLASKYSHGTVPLDELTQVANLGLLNAIDRFDPDRGIRFPSFAAPTILGELKRFFRDKSWTVRLPRSIHDLLAEVEKTIAKLTAELQRSPSVGEIAARLEVEPTEVLEALEADQNHRPLSLDRPVEEDEEGDISLEWIGEVDDGFELAERRIAIGDALPELDERELQVLRLRFWHDMTQSEIAAEMGYSQMHISRLLRRTLAKIHAAVSE
jgi:RNA polymerase sigma-B factor